MPFEIREDDLLGPEVATLLASHLENVSAHSPPGSVHALDLDGLRAPNVTFWSVWETSRIVGCGALKELDHTHGELKSMCTDPVHRRRGVASLLLEHLLAVARRRGYTRLSLETGSGPAFDAAQALYERFGFERCGSFAAYEEDSFSVFMTRPVEP